MNLVEFAIVWVLFELILIIDTRRPIDDRLSFRSNSFGCLTGGI